MSDDKMLSQEEIDALLNQSNKQEAEPNTEEEQLPDAEKDAPLAESDHTSPKTGNETGDTHQTSERIVTTGIPETEPELLSPEEKDALGEIGNISMGTASTTLSELLQQRVTITSPKVRVTTQKELFAAFQVPYMVIQVEFKEGLAGYNILIMQLRDTMVMANLMMGGDGTEIADQVSEMEVSAAAEAMNQMIGTASTSLATMFSRSINISPPVTAILEAPDQENFSLPIDDPIVVVSFRLTVGELLDTEIMQILSLETAKEEASLLWQGIYGLDMGAGTPAGEQAGAAPNNALKMPDPTPGPDNIQRTPLSPPEPGQAPVDDSLPQAGAGSTVSAQKQPGMEINQERLAMLMDIPLRATVVLGRTKKPIKEVLSYTPGAILELSSQVEEPVEILVNGVLVARGEVVVVNENFGVKITDILTPAERVQKLTE